MNFHPYFFLNDPFPKYNVSPIWIDLRSGIHKLLPAKNEADVLVSNNACEKYFVYYIGCPHPHYYNPKYFWTRHPRPTTRMWLLLSVLDPPAYACFFTSLTLTVVFMKLYTYFGKRMGLSCASEELTLIPFRFFVKSYLER